MNRPVNVINRDETAPIQPDVPPASRTRWASCLVTNV